MTHKPMTYKKKKGFTMVELVVVIAVIAVLVAVAIPVFVNIFAKANMNKDIATVETLNTVIAADEFNGAATSLGEAIEVLAADGRNFEEINSQIKNGEMIYDAQHNRFSLLEGGKLIYKGHEDTVYDKNAVNLHLWRLYHTTSAINSAKTNVYLSSKVSESERAQALNLTALISIDAGATPYAGTLTISNEGEANVEVRGRWNRVEVNLPNGTLSHYDYAEYMYIRQLLIEGYYEYGTVGTIEWEKMHGGAWTIDSEPHLALDIENVANSTYGQRHRDCEVHGYEQELYFENAFRNGDFAHTLTPVVYAESYPDYVISNAVFSKNPVVSNRLGSWFGWDAKTFTSCNAADAQYNYYTGDGTSALVFRSPEKNISTQLITRIVLFEGFTYDLSFMYMFQGMHKPSTSDVHMLLLREEDFPGEIDDRVPKAVYDFQNTPAGEHMFHHEVKNKEWTKASCTFTVPNTSGNENTHKPVSYYLYFHMYGMQADVLAFDEFTCYPTVQTVENIKAQTHFTHTHTSRFTVPDTCLMYQDEATGAWLGRYVASDPVLNSRITYNVGGAEYQQLEFDTEQDVDITTTFTFGTRVYSVTKTVKVRKAGMPATVVFLDEFGNEKFRDRNAHVGDVLKVNYSVEKENYRQNTWRDDQGNVVAVGSEYYVADSYVVFTPENYSPKLCGELLIDPYNEQRWTGWSNNDNTIVFNPAEKNIKISGEYAIGDKHEEHRHYTVELIAGVEYTFMATVQIDHMEIDGVGGNYFAVMVKEDGTNSIDYPILPVSSNFVLYGPNTTISNVTRQINATWVCPEDGKYFVSILAWSVDDSEITISNLSLRSSQEHCFTGAYDMYCNFCNYHRPSDSGLDMVDYNLFSDSSITKFNQAEWQNFNKASAKNTTWDLSTKTTYDSTVTNTDDGSGSLKIQHTGNAYMLKKFQLQPGYQYEIKFSYKTSADFSTTGDYYGNLYLVDVDAIDSEDTWSSDKVWRVSSRVISRSTEWYTWKRTFFVTGTQAKNFGVGIRLYGVTAGTVWIDDIVVRPFSPNENQIGVIGSFKEEYYQTSSTTEETNTGTVNVYNGWTDFTGWRFRNQVSYSEENAIPGETDSQSLMFTSKGYAGNMRYAFILQPGNYTLSIRYKYKNLKTVAGDSFIGLVYKDRMEVGDNRAPTWTENFETCGILIKSFNNGGDPKTITEWQTATISFSVEYTQEMYFVFKFNGNQAGSTIWLDELEVYKDLGENIFPNGNFNYGANDTYLKGSALEQDGWIGGWNWATNVGYVTEKSYDKGAGTGTLKIRMNEETKEGYDSVAGDYKGNVKKVFNVTGGLRYELSFMIWADNVTNTSVGSAQTAKIRLGKWNVAQAVHGGNWTDNSTSLARGTTSTSKYQSASFCSFPLLNPKGFTKQANGTYLLNPADAAQTWNSGGWIKVTFTFDADKTEPYYLGIMWNGFKEGSAIYIDDIQLRAIGEAQNKNLIQNGNFATSVGKDGSIVPVEYSYFETTPGWGGWTAADHTRKTDVSYTNDGSGSLKMINPADRSINNGNGYIGTQVYLQAGVRYEISFMIKIVNPTRFDDGWGWIEMRNSTEVGVEASNRTRLVDVGEMSVACDWKLVTGTFTPKESGYHYFMILAYGICFDELYLDDLSITPR